MKYLTIVFSLLIGVCQGQTPTFHIVSQIDEMESDRFSVTIWRGGTTTESKRDLPMVNGQINYQDTTSVPLLIRISLPEQKLFKRASSRGYYPVNSQHIWLVAEPDSTVQLQGHLSDFSEVYPKGGGENAVLVTLAKAYHPLLNKAVNLKVDVAVRSDELTGTEIANKKDELMSLNRQANEVLRSFLKENISSIAGLYFLNSAYVRKTVSMEEFKMLTDRVNEPYRKTLFYKQLVKRIEASKYDVGQEIFEIVSTRTPDGQKFATSDWKGEFYLIDFWGSWCMPCLNDVPFLKEFKESLKDKVKVLGIASDKDDKWRKAITDHQLDWQHILIGTGDQDFSTRLNVTGYPTKILVDPDGKIVYRSSGGGKESFDKMTTIIKSYNN